MAYPDLVLIPLQHDSKKPAVSGWSAPSSYLKHTKTVVDTQPKGFGILTGTANDLIVIDYDVKTPEAKETFTLENLQRHHGDDCYLVQTPSGGYHAYHRLEERHAKWYNSAGLVEDCVDIRTTGGYVVGAGSVIGDKEYRAVNGSITALTPMPDRLYEILNSKTPERREVSHASEGFTDEVLAGLEDLGFTKIKPLSGATSDYNFTCAQMGRWGSACPLCGNKHQNNNFFILKQDDGSVWVKNHSDKCRMAKATNSNFLFQLEGVEPPPPLTCKEKQQHERKTEYERKKIDFELMVSKISSKCVYTVENPNGSTNLHTLSQLRERFSHMSCENPETGKKTSFVETWSRDEDKREYLDIDFLPNELHRDDCYNMWKGFAVEKWMDEPSHDIQPFHRLVECLTDGNADYFLKWLADIFQNPHRKSGVMCFITGKQGIGKGSLKNLLNELIGDDMFSTTSSPENDLFGKFANHTRNKMLCVLEEVEMKKMKGGTSMFKDLITEKTTGYEEKGVMKTQVKSFVRFLGLSNYDNALVVERDDRRTCAYKARPDLRNDKVFFDMWNKWIENRSNLKGVYQYLMSITLDGVDWVKDRPDTVLYREMREACLPAEVKWLIHITTEDTPLGWEGAVSTKHDTLVEKFKSFCFENISGYTVHSSTFSKKLLKLIRDDGLPLTTSNNGKSLRRWEFRLGEVREWLLENKYITD